MTGMEHTIEQVAEVLIAHPSVPTYGDASRDVCPSCPEADVAGPNSPSHAAHQARALAEAGLLAPAPLIEIRAETKFGETYRRWATDWEPVDRAEGDGRDDADRAADAIQAVLDGRAEVRWCAAEEVPSEGDGRADQ